jgi:hypothetical protein
MSLLRWGGLIPLSLPPLGFPSLILDIFKRQRKYIIFLFITSAVYFWVSGNAVSVMTSTNLVPEISIKKYLSPWSAKQE